KAFSTDGHNLPPGGILALGLPSHTGTLEEVLAKASERAISRLASEKRIPKDVEILVAKIIRFGEVPPKVLHRF
ncbi:MAG TPA: hypothetical protein VH396_22495, partial [Chitinophagaceae bacterium]